MRHILGHALLTSLLWLVGIGTLGGLWVARRVLNRVEAINANARKIVAGDLAGRLPVAGTGDELDRLVQNLNAMLDRIGELMAGLKQVSDNIAHDLKTPLTRLRGRAEQALQFGKTPEDYRGALEKVIEESDRLIQIFDALLNDRARRGGLGPRGDGRFRRRPRRAGRRRTLRAGGRRARLCAAKSTPSRSCSFMAAAS